MNDLSSQYDVIILGAGAAGLICAISAGRRGRRVLVLEKANKVGKKILMSGGGRCNFTNYFVTAENFISDNPHFCKAALNRFTQWDFIAMVESHGIAYEERKHSQLFCINSASDILNMLLRECELVGVELVTDCEVNTIKPIPVPPSDPGPGPPSDPMPDPGPGPPSDPIRPEPIRPADADLAYCVRIQVGRGTDKSKQDVSCQSLVVATGALSIPTLGGSGMGYDIAQQFSLPILERRAGLVPFMFSDAMKPVCERLSGLALEACVHCNGQYFTENMLFTHRGVSGPVILQISNYWRPGDSIRVDLLPGVDAPAWLKESKRSQGRVQLNTLLNQRLAKALVAELQALWWPQQTTLPLMDFTDQRLLEIGGQLNNWQLKPSATEGFRTAEVTLGGVDTNNISSRTMEARDQAGLYFIGEVLDVTGHLGGFNFQWAWSSGYSAGLFV